MIGLKRKRKSLAPIMLELYLLRHGEAEARATNDAQRRLTAQGEAEIARAAQHMPKQFDGLIHSPYLRTEQSAGVVLAVCQTERIVVADWVTPDASVENAIEQFQSLSGVWLVVTHNPFVSYLAARLTALPVNQTSFSTGALARLSGPEALPGTLSFDWI